MIEDICEEEDMKNCKLDAIKAQEQYKKGSCGAKEM